MFQIRNGNLILKIRHLNRSKNKMSKMSCLNPFSSLNTPPKNVYMYNMDIRPKRFEKVYVILDILML